MMERGGSHDDDDDATTAADLPAGRVRSRAHVFPATWQPVAARSAPPRGGGDPALCTFAVELGEGARLLLEYSERDQRKGVQPRLDLSNCAAWSVEQPDFRWVGVGGENAAFGATPVLRAASLFERLQRRTRVSPVSTCTKHTHMQTQTQPRTTTPTHQKNKQLVWL